VLGILGSNVEVAASQRAPDWHQRLIAKREKVAEQAAYLAKREDSQMSVPPVDGLKPDVVGDSRPPEDQH
jgi:hypothetical protein